MSNRRDALPVRVDNVSKQFDRTVALDGVSLELHAGEIVGLLGPNGAGKTTLIRTILDIIKPDSGRIELFGGPFTPAIRNRIGYLPEERGLYPRQKVGAVLEYLGALKGMASAAARAERGRWLDRFDLAASADGKVEQLSKGNQQKIQIAATLMARPDIVVLDEPLSGLDPVSARLVTGVIRECADEGAAVLLSTHQMNTVEALCTRVFMIARGRRVLYGALDDIQRQYSSDAVLVRSSADCRACPLVSRVDPAGDARRGAVAVHLRDGAAPRDFLVWLVASGASVDSFERLTTPLEEIFVRVAGKPEVAA
jgi:ABC-2 type transport system ATP-binding protein